MNFLRGWCWTTTNLICFVYSIPQCIKSSPVCGFINLDWFFFLLLFLSFFVFFLMFNWFLEANFVDHIWIVLCWTLIPIETCVKCIWLTFCRVLVGVGSDHYPDMLLCLSSLAFQAALPAAASPERDQPHCIQGGSQQLSASPLSQ